MGKIEETLFIIPARGGSKGLPGKNILPLAGKPLILHTIDTARAITTDNNICLSSNDMKIIETVEAYGLKTPFIRPDYLATDYVGTREVVLHAIDFYENFFGLKYPYICILQPTSPFRTHLHIREAFELFTDDLEMLVSVKKSKANPYFNLFEEDKEGFLVRSKSGKFIRRQDCPEIYEYNGAIYLITTKSIKCKNIADISKTKKYVMDEISSHDIDSITDWEIAKILGKTFSPFRNIESKT